jgi:hypothetical protein
MGTGQATILAALVGAGAALIGTFVTLVVTRWLDDRRWTLMREQQETIERRQAYAKMKRTLDVWREAAVDLEGKPTKKDWEAYWVARQEAMQAAADLEMIGSPLALQAVGEALDQLLDLWWDYEVNGPEFVQSGPLWARMAYIDSRIDAFRDLARAEFGLEPEVEDSRVWLETPELVQRHVAQLRSSVRRTVRPESEEERKERLAYEARSQEMSRFMRLRGLEIDRGLPEQEATALLDQWEVEAEKRKIARADRDYWRQGDQWLAERSPARYGSQSQGHSGPPPTEKPTRHSHSRSTPAQR